MDETTDKDRIEDMIDKVMMVARGNYSTQIELSDKNDDLDSLAIGINMMINDIEEAFILRQKNEEKIKMQNIELKKLDLIKTGFMSITSHEIGTPVAAIKGYIQMIFKDLTEKIDLDTKKSFDVVFRNIERLEHLIKDILDFSRIESGRMKFEPKETNLDNLLFEIIETMKTHVSSKNIILDNKIDPNIPSLFIDRERIKQVLINLINNAIKFSYENSRIDINVLKNNSYVKFEIKDYGRGIPEEKIGNVFNLFYQVDKSHDSKIGGSGIGLAISRAIVLSHGGKIWVDSKINEGSSFCFSLPMKPVDNIEDRYKNIDMFNIENI
jgi:signal transduction histidine kinase